MSLKINGYKSALLNIVCALPCETRPLIDLLKLKKVNTKGFTLFSNTDKTIYLTISGVGKTKAAAATAYLHQFSQGGAHTCYINIGIAGSTDYELGDCLFIHKITEESTQYTWYPFLYRSLNLSSAHLLTVDTPQLTPIKNTLIDMEASGFYQSANLFVSNEQIQVVKIISDHCNEQSLQLKAKAIEKLIAAQTDKLLLMINYLLTLSEQEFLIYAENPYFEEFISQCHFTTYQQHQLREILRRWKGLFPHKNPLDTITVFNSSKQVLIDLQNALSE